MIEQSETISKLAAALVAAQAELKNPPKDSVNPHFKSRFADLATVRETVQPVLSRHKLGVTQFPTELAGIGPALCTMLVHESGEFLRATIALRPAKQDPQGVGAAMTYARRYGLQAVLGVVADDDDDGNAASQQRPAQQKSQQTQQKTDTQKSTPAATVRELWERMGKRANPTTGAELVAWLASADQSLTRLLGGEYTPGGLADSVAGFARVRDVEGLAGLSGGQLTAAWANAKQYVKVLADTVPAGAK